MSDLFWYASAFNQDLGDWAVHNVMDMRYMFASASAFDQDLGWCVGDGMKLTTTFDGTKCRSTSCGVGQKDAIGICEPFAHPCLISGATKQCVISSPTLIIAIMLVLLVGFSTCVCCRKKKDETYFAAARRVLYSCLCCCCPHTLRYRIYPLQTLRSLEYPQRRWRVADRNTVKIDEGPATMLRVVPGLYRPCDERGAQDWNGALFAQRGAANMVSFALDDGTYLRHCHYKLRAHRGGCSKLFRLDATFYAERDRFYPGSVSFHSVNVNAHYITYKKDNVLRIRKIKKENQKNACFKMTDKVDQPEEATSPKEATGPESPETRAAAKAKAAETVELSSFSKLTSFLFGEREEPEEEAAALPVLAEAEEAPTEQRPPPPPARRWFSSAEPAEPEPEPEPSAPKFEEMYNQIAAWYNQPENAALRARWGAYPDPEELQTWPGFVRVTNAFLDATVLDGEAVTSPGNVVVDAEPVSPSISFWAARPTEVD